MHPTSSSTPRHLTPPQVAARLGVGVAKVIEWILDGELVAINLARRGCTRPRYSISPQSLAEFELARRVTPSSGQRIAPRRNRPQNPPLRDYFPD